MTDIGLPHLYNIQYNLLAQFMYDKDDNGQYIIVNEPSFRVIGDNASRLQKAFAFQAGDIVTIPDYSSEVTAKATNNLPTYQITCESENCLQFNIVPFEAAETPQFRFIIPSYAA